MTVSIKRIYGMISPFIAFLKIESQSRIEKSFFCFVFLLWVRVKIDLMSAGLKYTVNSK